MNNYIDNSERGKTVPEGKGCVEWYELGTT